MLDRFLLIRPAPLTCFVSICKRYVRTASPANPPTPTELSSTTIKEEKTAVDSTGKVFTFKHGPPPDITPVDDLGPYEIRLQNIGCKNRRFDRIVVQRMKHSPNANEIIENLGSYDPMPNDKNEVLIALNLKRLRYWIGTEGVVINPWVQKLLGRSGFFPIDPADYVDAYRARKIAENRLRYPEKIDEEDKKEETT
jgi:small subunit ribosomal protein S16